LLTK
jgi:hypothetical protein